MVVIELEASRRGMFVSTGEASCQRFRSMFAGSRDPPEKEQVEDRQIEGFP